MVKAILSDASSNRLFSNGAFDGMGATLCERGGTVYVRGWRAGLRHRDGMETLSDG